LWNVGLEDEAAMSMPVSLLPIALAAGLASSPISNLHGINDTCDGVRRDDKGGVDE
jgi:hypothetical protein